MSLTLMTLICVGGVSAWYNTSSLGNCVKDTTWAPMQSLDQIRFESSVPSPPYSEGEYYTTLDRDVSIECKLPIISSDSLIALTYNSSYMANMKTANVKRRRFCQAAGGGVTEECEGPLPPADYKACTLGLYEADTMEEILDIPDHLPPLCSEERLDNLEIRANKTSAEPIIQLIIQKAGFLEEGTYQCTLLRNCNPSFNSTAPIEEQPAISISKQLYVKVYEWHDYRTDLMVASSILGGASLLAVISAILATPKGDRIDHL